MTRSEAAYRMGKANKGKKRSDSFKKKMSKISRNRVFSEETKLKISISRIGKKNWMWKDKPGRIALHEWVRNRKPKPELCEDCGLVPPRDLANISQEYHRDINDFEWLCRKCHMTKDGRIFKFWRKTI